jgi:hypothetical protein
LKANRCVKRSRTSCDGLGDYRAFPDDHLFIYVAASWNRYSTALTRTPPSRWTRTT